MKQYSIIVADDNQDSREIICELISYSPDFEVIGQAENGQELIELVLENPDIDVVLVDIRMPKLDGMNAIKECLKEIPDLRFVFITGYDNYAVEAFSLSAIDYLVKPIANERFFEALTKVRKRIRNEEKITQLNESPVITKANKLIIRNGKCTYYVPIEEILYVEKDGKETIIHTLNKTYTSFDTLEAISHHLDHSFFQSHRSFIINLSKISHIETSGRTYLAHFHNYAKSAYISKHKIQQVQLKLL